MNETSNTTTPQAPDLADARDGAEAGPPSRPMRQVATRSTTTQSASTRSTSTRSTSTRSTTTGGVDVRLQGPGRLIVTELQPSAAVGAGGAEGLPGRLPEGNVLVEVQRVSLCGSDFKLYDGAYGGPHAYPLRFGHEWSGIVLDPGDTTASAGDAVTGDCSKYCGACEPCRRDRNLCRRIGKFGITEDGFSLSRRPVDTRYLYRAPAGVGHDVLALTEPIAVAARALGRIPTDRWDGGVLVVGAGPLGCAAALLLTLARGQQVDLLEAAPQRAQRARDVVRGVRDVVDPVDLAQLDSYAAIVRHARYPVVVDATGTEGGLAQALAHCALGGAVVTLSMSRHVGLRADLLTAKAVTLMGSIGGTGDFEAVLDILQDHAAAFARLITRHVEASHAVDAFYGDRSVQLKTQIIFGGP